MGYGHKDLWLSLTFLTVATAAFYVASRMSGGYAFLSVLAGLSALCPFPSYFFSWIAQLGSEKRHAEIKSHIDNLIQSLGGGAVQHVDQQTLKRLYKKRDFPAMLGWIKQSMRLNLRVGLRIVDHRAKPPMWIEWTNTMPLVGTAEFRDKRVIINATREILGKPFDWIVAGFAHEMAHIVLCSINHKLQEDEKAVDLTAMILGYDKFMMKADYTTTEWVGFNTTRQKTEWLGYLTIPERQFIEPGIPATRTFGGQAGRDIDAVAKNIVVVDSRCEIQFESPAERRHFGWPLRDFDVSITFSSVDLAAGLSLWRLQRGMHELPDLWFR